MKLLSSSTALLLGCQLFGLVNANASCSTAYGSSSVKNPPTQYVTTTKTVTSTTTKVRTTQISVFTTKSSTHYSTITVPNPGVTPLASATNYTPASRRTSKLPSKRKPATPSAYPSPPPSYPKSSSSAKASSFPQAVRCTTTTTSTARTSTVFFTSTRTITASSAAATTTVQAKYPRYIYEACQPHNSLTHFKNRTLLGVSAGMSHEFCGDAGCYSDCSTENNFSGEYCGGPQGFLATCCDPAACCNAVVQDGTYSGWNWSPGYCTGVKLGPNYQYGEESWVFYGIATGSDPGIEENGYPILGNGKGRGGEFGGVCSGRCGNAQ